jgi:acetyl-CoA acetyltransferase
MGKSLRDKAAITGIGETVYSKATDRSALSLTLEACLKAITDAGLVPDDIDGLIPYPSQGLTAESLITNFGLKNVRYSALTPMGGASPVAALQSAAMAIASGVAQNVLICLARGYTESNDGKITARLAEMPQMNTVGEFEMPLGANAPAQFYAPMARRHMEIFGTTSAQFAEIAITCRNNAMLNDKALMRKPMSLEDHQASRMISDPLRLYDCCLESKGAAAVVISSKDRANDLKQPPISILGVAEGHPDSPSTITQRENFVTLGIAKAAPIAFRMADVTPADINVAQIYDCFTYIVLCQLEDMGFCEKGEGGQFVTSGAIGLKGKIPINTHGGLLSEAHIAGMNHINELVRQLRRTCGERQIEDASVGLVTGYGDLGDGSIAILSR